MLAERDDVGRGAAHVVVHPGGVVQLGCGGGAHLARWRGDGGRRRAVRMAAVVSWRRPFSRFDSSRFQCDSRFGAIQPRVVFGRIRADSGGIWTVHGILMRIRYDSARVGFGRIRPELDATPVGAHYRGGESSSPTTCATSECAAHANECAAPVVVRGADAAPPLHVTMPRDDAAPRPRASHSSEPDSLICCAKCRKPPPTGTKLRKCRKLHTSLSTSEAEYKTQTYALKEGMYFINLLQSEMNIQITPVQTRMLTTNISNTKNL